MSIVCGLHRLLPLLVDLCVAHSGALSFVDLRVVHAFMSYIDLCCVSLMCVLRCVVVAMGRDRVL